MEEEGEGEEVEEGGERGEVLQIFVDYKAIRKLLPLLF